MKKPVVTVIEEDGTTVQIENPTVGWVTNPNLVVLSESDTNRVVQYGTSVVLIQFEN